MGDHPLTPACMLRTPLQEYSQIARLSGPDRPVRPSLKSQYPLIPMEQYARWGNEEGLASDPWMRVHSRLGARIAKTCEHSMVIRGTAADWQQWTGLRFAESGDYVVPDALCPVEMDRDTDCGQYLEPNVWMIHDLEGPHRPLPMMAAWDYLGAVNREVDTTGERERK